MSKSVSKKQLDDGLRELCLPWIREQYTIFAEQARAEDLSYEQYLYELVQQQCVQRHNNRIERNLRVSKLPLEKTVDTFDLKRLPPKVRHQLKVLQDGLFVDHKENVLAFGNPGSGKTHLLCALAHHLIQQDKRVYFAPCSLLVQELLRAKRDLKLDKYLKKLLRFEILMIDDLGYVQQSREEMEVLFTLLAERYERGSVLLTSNLPFSKWEQIFKDPMVTAAAIDRIVHHSVIIELNLPSYRMAQAKIRKEQGGDTE